VDCRNFEASIAHQHTKFQQNRQCIVALIQHISPSVLRRCITCRRGIAMRKLSVCPSVTRELWQNGSTICPDFYTNERWFSLVFALRLKKVCYKVSLCENCQRQCRKASIGLTIRAKIIGAGRHLLFEILDQTDRVGAKSPIFDLLSLVATQWQRLAKKSLVNTNRKSTTRFPMNL